MIFLNVNFEMAQLLATLAGFAVVASSIYYSRAPLEKDSSNDRLRSSLKYVIAWRLNFDWGQKFLGASIILFIASLIFAIFGYFQA